MELIFDRVYLIRGTLYECRMCPGPDMIFAEPSANGSDQSTGISKFGCSKKSFLHLIPYLLRANRILLHQVKTFANPIMYKVHSSGSPCLRNGLKYLVGKIGLFIAL